MSYKLFTKVTSSIIAITALIIGINGYAQAAAYIKYDGVDGEAKDSTHEGWINLVSFSQGVHQPSGGATGQSRRRGGAVVEDMKVEVAIDKSTTTLYDAVSQGKVFSNVTIDLCEGTPSTQCNPDKISNQHCYLKYELKNVLVTSYDINASGNDQGGRGVANMSLNFEEIKQEYTPSINECRLDN